MSKGTRYNNNCFDEDREAISRLFADAELEPIIFDPLVQTENPLQMSVGHIFILDYFETMDMPFLFSESLALAENELTEFSDPHHLSNNPGIFDLLSPTIDSTPSTSPGFNRDGIDLRGPEEATFSA